MNILIVFNKIIPVVKYGGIQRAAWWLGKELVRQGHKVTYLVGAGSECPFAEVLTYDPEKDLDQQIPEYIDVVHLYINPDKPLKKPYLLHMQSNTKQEAYDINTVFVSKNHAERHHADCFVYNGIDPDDYGVPELERERKYYHFLAKASWRVKNVKGAIEIAQKTRNRLDVIGGYRLNFKMGFRFTLDPNIKFHGMIGGIRKNEVINGSKGLIFPVMWHEPFGIAIIESMYFGCPVYATTYGSIPEIVDENSGFLSNNKSDIIEAVNNNSYNPKMIYERVMDCFSIKNMADSFLLLYEKVMNGEKLNRQTPHFIQGSEPKFLPFE